MNFAHYTKAGTLSNIKDKLSFFNVPKFVSFKAALNKGGKILISNEIQSLSKDSLLK